jgi:hypothetical protein
MDVTPPAAAAAAPIASSYKPIDDQAWQYIERALFPPLAKGTGQAPLGVLVDAIQRDTYLRGRYGQAAIDGLLRPVASPTGFLAPSASGSTFAAGKAIVWVGMDDFRRHCSPNASSSTSSPGKRKRSTTSSSIWRNFDLAREDLARLLKRVSSDMKREVEEGEAAVAAAEAAAAANARADGVLAGFGGKADELTRAIGEMEGVLEGYAAARREVAMARAEREAALEARMAFDPLEALAGERLGAFCIALVGVIVSFLLSGHNVTHHEHTNQTAPLTEEEQQEAQRILRQGGDLDIVVSAFNVDMLRQHLHTLRPRTWLNDEVRVRICFACLLVWGVCVWGCREQQADESCRPCFVCG